MTGNKVIQLLKSFSAYELNRLEKFLLSPYFNENDTLLSLFIYIKKKIKSQKEIPEEKIIWKSLFPKVPYKDTKFRHLCSDLNKLTEDFLKTEYQRTQKTESEIQLLKYFNQKNLQKHFSTHLKAIEKNLIQLSVNDSTFYRHRFLLESERGQNLERQRKFNEGIQCLTALDFYLDCYFIIEKLHNYCYSLNYKYIINKEVNVGLMYAIKEIKNDPKYLEVPLIAIYLDVANLLQNQSNELYYTNLKNTLLEKGHFLSKEELGGLYVYLQNFCAKKINSGESHYYSEMFGNFKNIIKNEIFLGGKMNAALFNNVTVTGIGAGEYEYVETFIHKYVERLPKNIQENELTYNLARLYFAQKKYAKVIEQLRTAEYKDVFYAMSARWMMVKTYYELDEYNALESLLDSFRIYLLRKKEITSTHRRQYLNMVRFVQKIIRLMPGDKKAKENLRKKIQESKAIAEKSWLLSIVQ